MNQIITSGTISFVFILYTLCCFIESTTGNSSLLLNKLYYYYFFPEFGKSRTKETTHLINIVTGCLQDYVSHDRSELRRRPPG